MKNLEQFIDELLILLPQLRSFIEETKIYWSPKKPPITLFMSDLAREVIELELTDELKMELFDIIETGVSTGQHDLSCSLTTGFLETYYSTLKMSGIIDDFFWKALGKESKEHINGVNCFYYGNCTRN